MATSHRPSVKWVYEGSHGYWRSYDKRFSIRPVYWGRTRPYSYAVRDEKDGIEVEETLIRHAKEWAEKRAAGHVV